MAGGFPRYRVPPLQKINPGFEVKLLNNENINEKINKISIKIAITAVIAALYAVLVVFLAILELRIFSL